MNSDDSPEPVAPRRRLLGRIGRGDRLALAILVLLPIALFLPPLFGGRLELPGDDLIQNLPLRILSGELIRAGRLPAWDPFIWSGTPLLAGWNAGALYPGTFLFAVLPVGISWVINLASAPLICGVGMYLWLRRLRVAPLGALLGALVFTYTGFMNGQLVHLGLAQGTAFLPFVLLAVDQLAREGTRRRHLGSVVVLAIALAATVLAGDPRAITSTAIAAVIFAAALFGRAATRRRFSLLVLGGVALGALLSAVQWLPGLTFLARSQRSAAAYSFFASGSLGITHLAVQLLVPFLLGGNGNLGLPIYEGPFNLPEVTVGCGFVALSAGLLYGLVLLGRFARFGRGERWRHDPRHLGAIYVIGIVGLVLTLGATIPLGHLLIHVPLFGNERLQNRNAVLFNLALAALVGFLVQDLTDSASELRAVLASRRRLIVALPAVVCIGIVAYSLARPGAIQRRLHSPAVVHGLISGMLPYLVATIVLACVVALVLLFTRRLGPARTLRFVTVLVVADVAMYLVNASYQEIPTSTVATSTPLSTALSAATGPNGRFAIYNPFFEPTGTDPLASYEVGATDVNVIQHRPSVEGYGSIVNGDYQNETSTHLEESFDQQALNTTTFDVLDLHTLATLPIYFGEPIPANAPIPLAISPAHFAHLNGIVGLPPAASGPFMVTPDQPVTFTLPRPETMRRATIALDPTTTTTSAVTLTVEVIGTDGRRVIRRAEAHGGQVRVSLGGVVSDELQVSADGTPATIGGAVVVLSNPNVRFLLNGALQGVLVAPHWNFAGTIGPFSLWNNPRTVGLAWLQSPSSSQPETNQISPGSVRILTDSVSASDRYEVDTPSAALLVRSESYTGGWTARIQPAGGGGIKVLAVHHFGLVQAIDLPPGKWIVTWRYAPASLLLGVIASGIGVVFLLLILLMFGLSRKG